MNACRLQLPCKVISSRDAIMTDIADDDAKGVTATCSICFDATAERNMQDVGPCLHRFCRTCLKGHVTAKLQERTFPIPCPEPGCSSSMGTSECKGVLQSAKHIEKLAQV